MGHPTPSTLSERKIDIALRNDQLRELLRTGEDPILCLVFDLLEEDHRSGEFIVEDSSVALLPNLPS